MARGLRKQVTMAVTKNTPVMVRTMKLFIYKLLYGFYKELSDVLELAAQSSEDNALLATAQFEECTEVGYACLYAKERSLPVEHDSLSLS